MRWFFSSNRGPARSPPEGRPKPIPHRYLTLRALRLLEKGHQLIVAGDASFLVFLDGIPDIALIAGDLLERGWVCPLPALHDAAEGGGPTYYTLSDLGADSLRVAEAWWRSLPFRERLQIRLWG